MAKGAISPAKGTNPHALDLAITIFRRRQTQPQARYRSSIMVAATAASKRIAMVTFAARDEDESEESLVCSRFKRDQREGRQVLMQVEGRSLTTIGSRQRLNLTRSSI